MEPIALIVPVLLNFKGFTELITSVDEPIYPIIIDNYNDNLGVAKSWNIGIERAKAFGLSAAIVVNDDVKFIPGTMAKLVKSLELYDLISAVASDTGQTGYWHHFPDFCCFAVNPQTFFDKFGRFDENFKPAYFEDNDMHYRIKLGGGKQGLQLDARVEHVGSVTNLKGGTNPDDRVVSHEQFRANERYYVTKWGGRPKEEAYDKPFNGVTGKTYKD